MSDKESELRSAGRGHKLPPRLTSKIYADGIGRGQEGKGHRTKVQKEAQLVREEKTKL
jgi:hypothetical protein